jgi:ABC-2 type transport system ATP-binding protein
MTRPLTREVTVNEDVPAVGPPAIDVSHLRKTYGETVAVDDVSFTVAEGEIFGLLGPNGAGKTTTVECAVGLRAADSGCVRVLGLDPAADRERLRLVAGVQLQSSTLPGQLKVGELLELYQSFYPDPADTTELAQSLGLAGKRGEYCQSLSGGQKQRLSIALALIGQPKVAVLDEMTTGLDPRARRDTWDLIEQVRDRGVTILLVTHHMEEAGRLCDKVALVDQGRIVAAGTPRELAQQADARTRVQFVPSEPFDDALLTGLPEVSGVGHHGPRVQVSGTGDLVSVVIAALTAHGVTAHDLELSSATLEDAFIQLTGHRAAPVPSSGAQSRQQDRSAQRKGWSLLPSRTPRRAFAKLTQAEARLAWRRPIGLAFGLAVPLLLLALFGAIPSFRHNKDLGGLTVVQLYFPVLAAFALAAIATLSLPIPLASYREQGILRRLSTTPVPPAWVLGAQLVVNACIAVAGMAILLLTGIAGLGLTMRSPGGFVLAAVLTALACLGIGLCIAGTARTTAGASGLAALVLYPMMFFAGLFTPLPVLPAIVTQIGEWTPLGAAVQALQDAMRTGFPPARFLLVLAGYALLTGMLAIRYFKWE